MWTRHPQVPIDLWPLFADNADELFRVFLANTPWDLRLHARKTASFGVPYNYSGMTYPAVPFPEWLTALRDKVTDAVGFVPNNALFNLYENEHSSMGFHGDSSHDLVPGSGIAIVSLGAPRTLTFRRKFPPSGDIPIPLAGGDLLLMSAEMQANSNDLADANGQEKWLHALPKAPIPVAPRISVTFRALR